MEPSPADVAPTADRDVCPCLCAAAADASWAAGPTDTLAEGFVVFIVARDVNDPDLDIPTDEVAVARLAATAAIAWDLRGTGPCAVWDSLLSAAVAVLTVCALPVAVDDASVSRAEDRCRVLVGVELVGMPIVPIAVGTGTSIRGVAGPPALTALEPLEVEADVSVGLVCFAREEVVGLQRDPQAAAPLRDALRLDEGAPVAMLWLVVLLLWLMLLMLLLCWGRGGGVRGMGMDALRGLEGNDADTTRGEDGAGDDVAALRFRLLPAAAEPPPAPAPAITLASLATPGGAPTLVVAADEG